MEDLELKKNEEEKPWRSSSLAERSLYALNTGYRSDCTFLIGSGELMTPFSCHVLPLSWASSKLAKMLQESKTHELPDVTPRYFRKLLEFVYADNTELRDMETTLAVWSVAYELEVLCLNQFCSTLARRFVLHNNVCKSLEFANRIKDQEFEEFCIKYIRENTLLVLHTESWEQISRDTLVAILSQDELKDTSERELFSACVKWARVHSEHEENMREFLGNALGLIRFRTFTTEEFAADVCLLNLLTPVEQRDILCCLAMGTAKMPEGFSTDSRPRCQRMSLSTHPSSDRSTSLTSTSVTSPLETESDEEPTDDFETQMATQQEAEEFINYGYARSGKSFSTILKEQSRIENAKATENKPHKPKSSEQPVMGEKASISLRYGPGKSISLRADEICKIPLSFSVSMAAFLFGVELRSQHSNTNCKIAPGTNVMESVQVILRDSYGTVQATGTFHGEAKHQDSYKVLFDVPFCLQPLNIYSIYVHYRDEGIVNRVNYEVSFSKKYQTPWGMQCSMLRILQIKYYTHIKSIIFGKKV